MVEIGKTYKHHKGNLYKILSVARHSETLEELVIYQGLYTDAEFGENPVWARPKKMFEEKGRFELQQ